MPLPQNFSPFAHLRSVLIRTHNNDVRAEFSDTGGADWDANINTGRASLRVACTIRATDSVSVVLIRLFLYFFVLRKVQDLTPPICGLPFSDVSSSRKFRPKITLEFEQDSWTVEANVRPVTGRLTITIQNETSQSITEAKLKQLGRKIETEFGSNQGYIWEKGKNYYSYTDKDKEYQFKFLAKNKTVAKNLIIKVLKIQDDTPDWKYLRENISDNPEASFPNNPGTQQILGKTKNKPRRRPLADVRFQYAVALLAGAGEPIILYDRIRRYKSLVNRPDVA